MEYKHDFAWGDTRGIREIMLKHAPFLNLMQFDFGTFGYPPHPGRPELREAISKLIEDLTGRRYQYVLVTNGALNGLAAYIHAARLNQNWIQAEATGAIHTNDLFFGRYPGLAANANLFHETDSEFPAPEREDIWIIDSPTNPTGELLAKGRLERCVWDAAYYTPTYCGFSNSGGKLECHPTKPLHEAMVGSLNKLTGINGLRIGWLATDNKLIYDKALEYMTSDLCGVSQPSQVVAHKLLKTVDMDAFYGESKAMLDDNKHEMSRLQALFSNQILPYHGMFWLVEVDQKLKDLLEKASVQVMPGDQCGDYDRESVRFNLGNSTKSMLAMVNDILKTDKI